MMKKHLALLMLAITFQVSTATSKAPSVRLSGHVPEKAVSNAQLLNRVDPATEVTMTFALPLRNQEELEELVQRIHNPADENYGKYLTPEEFHDRFAPTQKDYDRVVAYAKGLGFAVKGRHANRTLLNVSGSSETVEKAFDLRLHHYKKPNGHIFHAPDNDPNIPATIALMIHGIIGLDNHAVRRTYSRRKELTQEGVDAHAASNVYPSGPGGGYGPNDLLIAYNLNGVSANGSNQIIALFELGSYQASDINAYTNHFGLPAAKLTNILVDGGSGSGIDPEVTLDIELALALAPASEIYVYEGPNTDQGVLDTYNRIATDNRAKQVSTSWGLGESFSSSQFLQAENAIFLQMAAHGQTIYAAAGDSGAYDEYPYNSSLVVDDPASQPYVVGVGGTRLTVNSGSGAYGSESVWNDGLGNGSGGGGISGFWSIPSWQQNVATVVSKTRRNVPDVALNADQYTGYSIYYNGQWTIYGGTSCAAPLWAAFTALVNQARVVNQQAVLGFANPTLYSIGLGSSYMQNFHDITMGNNLHYSAGVGYDNASGWGSFNGANLFASLTGSSMVQPPPQLYPVFGISMTHSGSFMRGRTGTYTIVVQNQGQAATSGAVNVILTLPPGLTLRSFQGSGWTFNPATLTCHCTNALGIGASYPPISMTVTVSRNTRALVTPTATVSGGGAQSNATISNATAIR